LLGVIYNYNEIIFRLFNEFLDTYKDVGPFNKKYVTVDFYKGTLTIQFF